MSGFLLSGKQHHAHSSLAGFSKALFYKNVLQTLSYLAFQSSSANMWFCVNIQNYSTVAIISMRLTVFTGILISKKLYSLMGCLVKCAHLKSCYWQSWLKGQYTLNMPMKWTKEANLRKKKTWNLKCTVYLGVKQSMS